jgi:hypothetical protein
MARDKTKRCRSCEWHHLQACRRLPPIVFDPYTKESGFPKVAANGWCGEFTAVKKEEVPPQDKRGTWAGSPATSGDGFDQ